MLLSLVWSGILGYLGCGCGVGGTPGLWLRWVSCPQPSQSSLGWRMEPAGSLAAGTGMGCLGGRCSAPGAVCGGDSWPWGLFVGAMLSPGGCLWGRCLAPGAVYGGDARPHCRSPQSVGEMTLLCSHPKDSPKARKGSQAARHPISPHATPWPPQAEEQSAPAPIPAPSARLRCLPHRDARQARREQAPAAPTC